MRAALTILILIFLATIVKGQNLVTNWSFEDYTSCPTAGEVDRAVGWTQIYSADYYNSCVPNGDFNVPNTYAGFQNPETGNAFCGLATYYHYENQQLFLREFIRQSLSQPLQVGTKYFVSFKANLSNGFEFLNRDNCATNNLGILFSTYPVNGLTGFAQVFSEAIITDTISWTGICGSFLADSAYSYLNIGNFFMDTTTQVQPANSVNDCYSYYFIDNVCLSTDSLDCVCTVETGLANNNNRYSVTLFPNPTSGQVTLSLENFTNSERTFKLYDFSGRCVLTIPNTSSNSIVFDSSPFNAGLYLLQIEDDQRILVSEKLLIQ